MKKYVKVLSLLLVVVLSATLVLAGCSSKSGNNAKQEPQKQEPQKQEAPIEITYANYRDLAENDSIVTKKLPELLKAKGYNVTFKLKTYGTYDATQWDQKFTVEMAAGEKLPDIMQLGSLMPEGRKGGWFAELNMATLEKTMPKYVNEVNKRFSSLWALGKDPENGKLYGIPSFNMYGPNRHAFVYRGDWLKKMGIQAPTTLEEFESYLRKVRTMDPNGNGQNDEYGYTAEDSTRGPAFGEIFAAYGIMPGQWLLKDNKIVRGDIQPEAKEGLKWLAKWYSEGLIPKGVMTTSKDRDDFYANKIGAMGQGFAYGPAIAKDGYIEVAMRKVPGAELLVAPPPKGPTGKYGTWEFGPLKYVIAFGKHMEKDIPKMEKICSMFELIATDKQLFELTMLGEKGVHWDFVNKSAGKGAITYIPPFEDVNKRLKEVGVRDLSESAFCPIWVEDVYKDYIDPDAMKYSTMNPGMYDAIERIKLPSASKYDADLITLAKVTYLEIITGKKPMESFDDFVKKWNANGGEQLTKEANELYDKSFRKK